MIVKIKDREVEIKQTFRSLMIYEKIANESFNPKGITEIIIYFYSTLLASEPNLTLTFDEFVYHLDNEPNLINDFTNWMVQVSEVNKQFKDDQEPQTGKEVDTKKK